MALIDELREAINLSHAKAWDEAITLSTTPDEPGLVAMFLSTTTQNRIQSALQASFPSGMNMQLSSVFTHKTPVVEPVGAPNGVEIGDLLLIRQHFSTGYAGPATAGRALLLQAKKNATPSSGSIPRGNPTIQFELYRDWPDFRGRTHLRTGPNGLPGGLWDFTSASGRQDFGQYLAVYDGHAYNLAPGASPPISPHPHSGLSGSGYPPSGSKTASTWASGLVPTTALAPNPVACHDDFAQTLEDFAQGWAGVPFTPGTATDHWSIFVNRMLSVAASARYTFSAARVGLPHGSRRGVDFLALRGAQPYFALALHDLIAEGVASAPSRIQLLNEGRFAVSLSDPFLRDLVEQGFLKPGPVNAEGGGPPVKTAREGSDNDDEGHVPVLVLATSGPEMPPGLRDLPPSDGS